MSSEQFFVRILALIGIFTVGGCLLVECVLAARRGYTVIDRWTKIQTSDLRVIFYSLLAIYFILGVACLAGVTYGVVYLLRNH